MTRRVNNSTDYQLPPGRLWWLCLFSDGPYVSEMLFTDERAGTWYYADKLAQVLIRERGFSKLPIYKVTLHGQE